VIGTPALAETAIQLAGGKVFRIVANGLDFAHRNRYVQSATLNGKPIDRAWFRHSEIRDGASLVLNMGPKAGKWGTRNTPPSGLVLIAR
jgi:putative alpha-1,2-mannosidase